MTLPDLVIVPLVLYIGHQLVSWVVAHYHIQEQKRLLIRLFYYHLAFSIIYALYVSTFGGDAVGYWKYPFRFLPQGSSWMDLYQSGTPFVFFLTYPFAQLMGISFWGGTILFSLFGFAGFLFIFLTLLKVMKINPTVFGLRLFPLVLFLPNVHFWSAGVGKDSIMFFALSLFIFSLTNPLKNIFGIILSFYLAYYIRPHMALLMTIGFAFSLLLSTRGVSLFWRVGFLGLAIYAFFLIAPAVFDFIGLEEEALENYEDVASIRSKNLSRSNVGSAINIRDYNVPMKIFTFFFRPLFVDAGNIFGLIVSLENLFYLILALSLIRLRNFVEILTMPMHLKASLFVLSSTAFFMSSSLSNLGIIIRQKNMVMFMFLLIAMYLLGKAQEKQLADYRPVRSPSPHAEAPTA